MILASAGDGDSQTYVITSCNQMSLPRGGAVFWRALDWSPDGQTLYGVSDDELYVVDPVTGEAELLGEIGFSAGGRSRFRSELDAAPATVTYAQPGATGPVTWNLRATIQLVTEDIPGVPEEHEFFVNLTGIFAGGDTYQYFVDESFEIYGEAVVRLFGIFVSDGVAEFSLITTVGDVEGVVSGTFTTVLPNDGNAEPLALVAAGLSVAPNGDVYILSDPESDPFGDAAIYQLDLTGPDIVADYVAVPSGPELHAIEFADDGRLFGAGSEIVLIDPILGWTIPQVVLGESAVVELDYGAGDRLYAMCHESDGRSTLRDVTPGPDAGEVLAYLHTADYWGMAIRDFALGDLDLDGDVDTADTREYVAQYTGAQSGPYVPPGVPDPPFPTVLPVPPLSVFCGQNCMEGYYYSPPAVYDFDALDYSAPGVVVEGGTGSIANTSASLELAHTGSALQITVRVTDDLVQYPGSQYVADAVEFYLDSNNSDLEFTEASPFGFRARYDSKRHIGGDATAYSAWSGSTSAFYRPGFVAQFTVPFQPAGLWVGGTFGFDVAVFDSDQTFHDREALRYYFLFSDSAAGQHDERLWGDIFLSPEPQAAMATEPLPANRAQSVDVRSELSWSSDERADAHRIYVGIDPDALVYQGEQTARDFSPGMLSAGTEYFWRIDEVNMSGVRRGTTWRFTTASSSADVDRDGDVDEHDARRMFQRPLGDLDHDGDVDAFDYQAFVAVLGSMEGEQAYEPMADYDSDGQITLDDYAIWQCHYLENGNTPLGDLDGDGDIDSADYVVFIDCMSGPVIPVSVPCFPADFNSDDHVDLRDAAMVHALLTVELRR